MIISRTCFILLTVFMAYEAYKNEDVASQIVILYLIYIVIQIIVPNGALSNYRDYLSAILIELLGK